MEIVLARIINYLCDFLGAREPIRSNWRPTLVIFAVAGKEGIFRSSPSRDRPKRAIMYSNMKEGTRK